MKIYASRRVLGISSCGFCNSSSPAKHCHCDRNCKGCKRRSSSRCNRDVDESRDWGAEHRGHRRLWRIHNRRSGCGKLFAKHKQARLQKHHVRQFSTPGRPERQNGRYPRSGREHAEGYGGGDRAAYQHSNLRCRPGSIKGRIGEYSAQRSCFLATDPAHSGRLVHTRWIKSLYRLQRHSIHVGHRIS